MFAFAQGIADVSPGYYMALSNFCDRTTECPLVRIYWNLKAEGEAQFVGALRVSLTRPASSSGSRSWTIPTLTCAATRELSYRKSDHQKMSAALADAYPGIAPCLKSAVPMFTRRIASGVGLAEDPDTQESFGQHRCRILADGNPRGMSSA